MQHYEFQKYLADSLSTTGKPFAALRPAQKIAIARELLQLQTRILFSHRFLYVLGAIFLYFLIFYVVNYQQPIYDRIQAHNVLPLLLELPLMALAVYLGMQVISMEKENRTLETMFTVAGNPFRVWLLRFFTLHFILIVLTFALSVLSYYTFVEFPIVGAALHAIAPIFFVTNMTIFLAVRLRSGFAAAMVSVGILLLTLMFSEVLHDTRYFLFFNPYQVPRRVDPETWNLWMWQNKIGLFLLGGLLLFFALRGLLERERLLR